MKNMSDNETLIFVITCNEKRTMYSKSDSSINIAQLEGIRTVWAQKITPKKLVPHLHTYTPYLQLFSDK